MHHLAGTQCCATTLLGAVLLGEEAAMSRRGCRCLKVSPFLSQVPSSQQLQLAHAGRLQPAAEAVPGISWSNSPCSQLFVVSGKRGTGRGGAGRVFVSPAAQRMLLELWEKKQP